MESPLVYWQSHYQQKCPIYQNSKAVRDMVLLLMGAQQPLALVWPSPQSTGETTLCCSPFCGMHLRNEATIDWGLRTLMYEDATAANYRIYASMCMYVCVVFCSNKGLCLFS
jgi:hypothetical protein